MTCGVYSVCHVGAGDRSQVIRLDGQQLVPDGSVLNTLTVCNLKLQYRANRGFLKIKTVVLKESHETNLLKKKIFNRSKKSTGLKGKGSTVGTEVEALLPPGGDGGK